MTTWMPYRIDRGRGGCPGPYRGKPWSGRTRITPDGLRFTVRTLSSPLEMKPCPSGTVGSDLGESEKAGRLF